MPPSTGLLELATRRNSYVCRSCLALLRTQHAPSPPPPRFVRGFFGKYGRKKEADVREQPGPEDDVDEVPKDKGYSVNYFLKDDETGHVQRLPIEDGDRDEDEVTEEQLEELGRSMRAKGQKLDETLKKLNLRTKILEQILAKHAPKGALEAFWATLDSFENEDESGLIPLIAEDRDDLYGSRKQLHKMNDQIEQLNKWIEIGRKALKDNKLGKDHINKTWRFFSVAVPIITKPQFIVPQAAWDTLWEIFSYDHDRNPSRISHIYYMINVMKRAGATLNDQQCLLSIESAFFQGYEAVAIEEWKRGCVTLGEKDGISTSFWELGVRMFSQTGDIERAERASKAMFERATQQHPANPRVLYELISAYAASSKTAEKAFKLYRRMRELAEKLGKPMDIEDYDDVISIFLRTGHTDFALYAFTDMMFAGTVNLWGHSKLPNDLRNHFFFGKWLKRLIGANDLDGAYQVLIHMQKHGVMAASVQVNGLIGAWLRSGTVENRNKADKLAQAMIHSRKTFVDLRKRQNEMEWPMRLMDGRPNRPEHQGDDLDYTMVPRATVETFTLMADNYRGRNLFNKLEALFISYKECEMPHDALMMNELMMAAVAQNRGDKARELYELMVHEHDILPNVDTFAIMFSALPVNLLRGPAIKPEHAEVSSKGARALFRDMMSSSWVFHERERPRKNCISEAQVKLMLHSFRKADDYAGVAAALIGLRDILKFEITRGVLLELIAEYQGIDRPTARAGKVVMSATQKVQDLVHNMRERGYLPEEGTLEAAKEPHVLYQIMLDYYYNKLQKFLPGEGVAGQAIEEAKEDMGVDWAEARDHIQARAR